MVIAVMGGTFERVSEQTETYIMREKLVLIYNNYYRFPASITNSLKEFKYLLSVDVDPEVDPIEVDSMEKRLTDNVNGLKESMASQAEGLSRIALSLDTLYDKMCSNDKNERSNKE